jgi:hypothetical protein
VTLADFDEDGDVDALVSNISWGEFFFNQGDGTFSAGRFAELPSTSGMYFGQWRFATAGLNGDERPDIFLAACCGGGYQNTDGAFVAGNPFNTVWLSGATLQQTGQRFGSGSTADVALADLDGDGDVDAFGANNFYIGSGGEPVTDADAVWLNDGRGRFVDSGQRLGDGRSLAVAAGDIDGDGDADAVVGKVGPAEVWLNDGRGHFTDSRQPFGEGNIAFVSLADFDGDGDLDALLGDNRQATLWLNDGGAFHYSGQRFRSGSRPAVAVGDVDGNGAPDVLVAHLNAATVWLNDGQGRLHRP